MTEVMAPYFTAILLYYYTALILFCHTNILLYYYDLSKDVEDQAPAAESSYGGDSNILLYYYTIIPLRDCCYTNTTTRLLLGYEPAGSARQR